MAICNNPNAWTPPSLKIEENPNESNFGYKKDGSYSLPNGRVPTITIPELQTRNALRKIDENVFALAKMLNDLKNNLGNLGAGVGVLDGMSPAIVVGTKGKGVYECDVYGNGIGAKPTLTKHKMVACDTNFWGEGLTIGDIVLVASVNVQKIKIKKV